MRPGVPRRTLRPLAALTLAAYLPFALDGCVSIKVAPRAAPAAQEAGTGSFRFLAVRKAADRGKPEAAAGGVIAALWREAGGEEQVVWRQAGGDWTVRELPPGRYHLHVERVIEADGEADEPRGELAHEVVLHAGETTQANVVLQKTPWGLIVVLSVTVVLLIVALVVLAESGGFDLPDGGDLAALAPPFPPLAPEAVVVGLEFVELTVDEREDRRVPTEEATVLHASPEDGAVEVATSAAVDVELSEAIDPLTVDQRTFGLFAGGRQLPAAIAVRDRGRRLHLEPLAPLPAGADVTARLMGSRIRLAADEADTLDENYAWSFAVAAGR